MAPQQVRDPMPYGSLFVTLMDIIRVGHVLLAAAAIVQLDTYMCPSEVLQLFREDLYPPAKAAGARFAREGILCRHSPQRTRRGGQHR